MAPDACFEGAASLQARAHGALHPGGNISFVFPKECWWFVFFSFQVGGKVAMFLDVVLVIASCEGDCGSWDRRAGSNAVCSGRYPQDPLGVHWSSGV